MLLKNINIHGAYAHLFMDDASINREGATRDILIGQYSEQIKYRRASNGLAFLV